LALTQILFIVGLSWIGVAGKLGPSHVIFWLLALVLFYLPSAVVVMYLNRLMPLEGGLYQWAKLGFNQSVGFLLAWNLWLYVIVFASEIGLTAATYLTYAIGPSAAWMTSSTWFVMLCTAGILSLMVVAPTIGLSGRQRLHTTRGACSRPGPSSCSARPRRGRGCSSRRRAPCRWSPVGTACCRRGSASCTQ